MKLRIKLRFPALLVLALAASSCSFYDVATQTADAILGTGSFSDNNARTLEWPPRRVEVGVWNPETSQCIRDEKKLRPILQQLDAEVAEALREGKDFVVLPTGEEYPINKRSLSEEPLPSPTYTCLSRTPPPDRNWHLREDPEFRLGDK